MRSQRRRGGSIEVAKGLSSFNSQDYCSILKVSVILCKHASKNSCVAFGISITSAICVFIQLGCQSLQVAINSLQAKKFKSVYSDFFFNARLRS